MSSHHIIREKQEPALIIQDLEGIDREQLGQLLEWSPTIVALEQCLEAVDLEGIKIDHAIVREGRSNHWEQTLAQGPIKFHESRLPSLEESIKILSSKDHDAVNIVAGQLSIEDFAQLAESKLVTDISLITSRKKVSFNHAGLFSKWYMKGEQIEIFAFGGTSEFETSGFLQGSNLQSTRHHALTTSKQGIVEINSKYDFLLVEKL